MLAINRRTLLQRSGSLVLLLGSAEIAFGATIVAVRVWPAQDYTRVTIESDAALQYTTFFVADPPRLAVDIQGIDLLPGLRELIRRVQPDDPFISGVRAGQNTPGVVRLVLDLKQAVQPQVFSLTPIAAYQFRLVFDLYPAKPVDPLEAFIAQQGDAKPSEAHATAANKPSEASTVASNRPDSLGDWIARQSQSDKIAGASAESAPPKNIANAQPTPRLRETTQLDATANTPPRRPSGKTDRLVIVALDPGHGGEDPGATGPAGNHEKDVVLQIAHRLRALIDSATVRVNGSEISMRTFMTRDADFFVPLGVRVQKARQVQADLFVSIHADAFITPQARGASVFALSDQGASSAAARWMANKENNADLVGGINVKSKDSQVQRALLDMSTTSQINSSLKLGSDLLGAIGKVGSLHKGRVEQAAFAVLKAPDIPSVLVETAFISNPEEEQKLLTDSYQQDLAQAVMEGIQRYFAQNPPKPKLRTA